MVNVRIYDGNGVEVLDRRLLVGTNYVVNVYVTGALNFPESFAPVRLEILETGYSADDQADLFGVVDFVVNFPQSGSFTLRASESSGLILDSPSTRDIPVSVGTSQATIPVPPAQEEQGTGSIISSVFPDLFGPLGWAIGAIGFVVLGSYALSFIKK